MAGQAFERQLVPGITATREAAKHPETSAGIARQTYQYQYMIPFSNQLLFATNKLMLRQYFQMC
jgi:hypothetical protein